LDDPLGVTGTFADLLRAGQLPDKAAYDLRRLADVYDRPADSRVAA
jgi:hypothetical protein